MEFDAFGARWRCALADHGCAKVEDHVGSNPLEVKSPDGKWAVSRRGHDLWIRSLATGEERALTTDGTADHSYGSPPDCLSFGAILRKVGVPHLPPLVAWSPDSRHLVTHRLDQRGVRRQHLVEGRAAGRRDRLPSTPITIPIPATRRSEWRT